MPPLADAAVPALMSRFRRQLEGIEQRSATAVALAWWELGAYDEVNVAAFAAATEPIVAASTSATVASATAFYSTLAGVTPPTIPAALIPAPKWDPREPFTAYWHSLGEGNPWSQAWNSGSTVAQVAVGDAATSTARSMASIVVELSPTSELHGAQLRWERVPLPSACDWCLDHASTGYATPEDADYGHDNCRCLILPTVVI